MGLITCEVVRPPTLPFTLDVLPVREILFYFCLDFGDFGFRDQVDFCHFLFSPVKQADEVIGWEGLLLVGVGGAIVDQWDSFARFDRHFFRLFKVLRGIGVKTGTLRSLRLLQRRRRRTRHGFEFTSWWQLDTLFFSALQLFRVKARLLRLFVHRWLFETCLSHRFIKILERRILKHHLLLANNLL